MSAPSSDLTTEEQPSSRVLGRTGSGPSGAKALPQGGAARTARVADVTPLRPMETLRRALPALAPGAAGRSDRPAVTRTPSVALRERIRALQRSGKSRH